VKCNRDPQPDVVLVTEQVLESARQVVRKTAKIKGVDVASSLGIDPLRQQIRAYYELGDRVIAPTRRRVIEGEQVPANEKVYSIFEPPRDLIQRGKQRKPLEFGHPGFLAESAPGLITDYPILQGNPADTAPVQASLDRPQQVFHCAPEWYAGDRGFYSAGHEDDCRKAGVSKICRPSEAGSRPRSGRPSSAARTSKRANAFASASKVASRCCFAAGG
jgi:IS5 family transposase